MTKDLSMLTTIAQNLKRIRTSKGLSINELAKLSGINSEYIKKIEDDNAPGLSFYKIIKIKYVLDVKFEELLA